MSLQPSVREVPNSIMPRVLILLKHLPIYPATERPLEPVLCISIVKGGLEQ